MSRTRLFRREKFEDPREELSDYLNHFRELRLAHGKPPGFHYVGAEDFLLTEGVFYDLSPNVPREMGIEKACFYNAARYAIRHRLRYVEGYATAVIGKGMHFPAAHAWVLDAKGRAIELTWRIPGAAYLGVEFPIDEAIAANKAGSLSILDDPGRGWPIYKRPFELRRA